MEVTPEQELPAAIATAGLELDDISEWCSPTPTETTWTASSTSVGGS